MKMPRVQSMGVVPIRDTGDITDLNVMMQGKPALTTGEEEIAAIQEVCILLNQGKDLEILNLSSEAGTIFQRYALV